MKKKSCKLSGLLLAYASVIISSFARRINDPEEEMLFSENDIRII